MGHHPPRLRRRRALRGSPPSVSRDAAQQSATGPVYVPPVVRSCTVVSAISAGRQAHCDAVKHGLSSDMHFQSALLAMYAQNGEIAEAELVFRETVLKNLVSWTAMVAGYAQNGAYEKAAGAFRRMAAAGVRPNEVAVTSVLPVVRSAEEIHGYAIKSGFGSFNAVGNALIAAYGKCGQLDIARQLFGRMRDRTVVSWNAIIAAYQRNGEGKMAIEIFRRMLTERVDFDYITLVSVISACASSVSLDVGRCLHRVVRKRGLLNNPSIGNALLDMYAKCGSLEAAREVFDELPHRSVVSWSAMISAYATHGRGEESLKLFSRMKSEGPPPNRLTFLSVLSACSHSGLAVEGREIFNSMKRDFSLTPSLEHYACMVDLLSRAGSLPEACAFIEEMPIRPDTGVWAALLGGCRVHGDLSMAETATERLLRLDPRCATGYVLLASVYAEAGRWEDAEKLRKTMKQAAMQKKPGHSLVKTITTP
ncbi:unnamed protein product [Spirodela intermedia]|uniref:Uncharacterized protein n=1 Tax=Spirodela intermedia TaxID=51605 RepID=A0A7I8J4D4_SPIIN|nr:unnamed protein product [Spirodela intermedia]CAA6664231.1 unnamed protein product [Spirodela intermedia]